MRFAMLGLSLAALLSTTVAGAAGKPEDAIHYRHAAYTVIGWNFGPMAQMVKGKLPWDAKDFALRADRVAAMAPQLLEGFPEGSDTGIKTDAKPEIWKDMADFKAKMDDFVKESQQLAAVAKGGDEAKMKEQFGKTAETCKSCHQKYRKD